MAAMSREPFFKPSVIAVLVSMVRLSAATLTSTTTTLLVSPNPSSIGQSVALAATVSLYHYDMGFEYVIPANDAYGDVYFYDFQSGHWWYTGPSLFQNIYDFTLGAWIYYFPDPSNPGHYTTNPRKFAYDMTHVVFTM
jgi:hypothetical protein